MIFQSCSTFTLCDKFTDAYDLVTVKWFTTKVSNYVNCRWNFSFSKGNELDDCDKIVLTRHSSIYL